MNDFKQQVHKESIDNELVAKDAQDRLKQKLIREAKLISVFDSCEPSLFH